MTIPVTGYGWEPVYVIVMVLESKFVRAAQRRRRAIGLEFNQVL